MYFRVRSLFVASAVIVTSQPLPPRDSFTDFLPLNRSFEFQVNCGSLTEFNCAQVKLGLKTVGNLIAAEILFKVPILVGVTFVEESFSHFHKYSIMLGTQPAIGIVYLIQLRKRSMEVNWDRCSLTQTY